jgi:teichuronic acid biosynthesis glycosyltransferase TuaC
LVVWHWPAAASAHNNNRHGKGAEQKCFALLHVWVMDAHDSPRGPFMNILVFSSLYPNAVQPNFGVFVENRARRLADAGVAVQVVAPVFVPAFPFSLFRRFRKPLPPLLEQRHGLSVHHPRVPQIPGLWARNPGAMSGACLPLLRDIRKDFSFEAIDAHYFFPDGVAAARLAKILDVPCVITSRGSDITDWPNRPAAKRMILAAAASAQGLAAVSDSLRDGMAALGMAADKITVLRNGVDLDHFAPGDRAAAKFKYGVQGPCVVSVANLVPLKSHAVTIDAVATLPGVTLLIAGDGPERGALQAQIAASGAADRIRLLGPVAPADLPQLYNAGDIFVLSSTREGMPNVVLEAIACGTPVIATPVGGSVEVLADARAGCTYPVGDAQALRAALETFMRTPPDRAAVRDSALRFSWVATTRAQLAQLAQIIRR